jgi:hypothetical protein
LIRDGVLVALAQATDSGLLEAAELQTRGLDPFLRPWIKRGVRRAIEAARARTTLESPEHILKLAFLSVAGSPLPSDLDDEASVSAAYAPVAAARLKNRISVWPVSLALLVVVLGSISFTLIRFFMPTAEQRFRGTALGEGLSDPLTQWVVALNADQPEQTGIVRWQIASPLVLAQIGAKPHAALGAVLDAAEATHTSPEPTTEAAFGPLLGALNGFNASLAAIHVPAYMSAYGRGTPGHRVVWLASYYARQRDDIAMADVHAPAIWGVRLDSLNLADSVAFKLDGEEATLLSLDRLEEELIKNWLRPAGRGEAMAEAATLSRDGPSGLALARSAGPVIGKELADAAHLPLDEAKTIAGVLENRNAAAAELRAKGYRVASRDNRLSLDRTTVTGLERLRGQEPQIDEMLKQDTLLASYVKMLAPAVDLLATLVEEEFVASLAEVRRLREVAVPVLAEHGIDRPAYRARASAELAKLARPQACPKLALWRTARLVVSEDFSREEQEVGIIVLDAVFTELGLPGRSVWGGQGLEGGDMPKALQAALEKPASDVRNAATRGYDAVFHAPPPKFARKSLP